MYVVTQSDRVYKPKQTIKISSHKTPNLTKSINGQKYTNKWTWHRINATRFWFCFFWRNHRMFYRKSIEFLHRIVSNFIWIVFFFTNMCAHRSIVKSNVILSFLASVWCEGIRILLTYDDYYQIHIEICLLLFILSLSFSVRGSACVVYRSFLNIVFNCIVV